MNQITESKMLHLSHAPTDAPKRAAAAPKQTAGELFSKSINLSGRRRFTSQRLVLYALLASQGREGALATAHDALAIFRDAHAALLDGELSPKLMGGELKEAYFGADKANERIVAFVELAQRTLDALAAHMHSAASLLEELVDAATPLLATLNRLTQLYEDLARQQAASAKKQLTAVMGDIELIAKHARIVSFNAQVVAARAGHSGREFAVVSGELTQITGKLDGLVREAVRSAVA
ncbi:type IV pili methyl-accepting chemotaxis transducer N-terminal domain-containing protein [Roseateles sp. BYS78W]|uniref:Type IV pili methyl-accepting chemotaxis transducer N-terminal domain-containing protein n=1 Tax=Pelomonas candidula TaxID=3299025 RepID=A0ABW7HJ43_9BURK